MITSKKMDLGKPKESYDRGNGATILLYNKTSQTVILTQQFRMPTFLMATKTE